MLFRSRRVAYCTLLFILLYYAMRDSPSQNLQQNLIHDSPSDVDVKVKDAVSYSDRALIVNNSSKLLWVASIHYPRSVPSVWKELFERSKNAGINAIDTYVFWNLHEEEEGVYDFQTGSKNLPLFLQTAKEMGLDVVLRIGPYVCAEFNFGGFPPWLLHKKGIKVRTYNEVFMEYMEKFVEKVIEVVRPFLASNGGPIILLQMENEYITFEWLHFPMGHFYISWAAKLAQRLDVGVPWFMCEQGNIKTLLNTYNGHYAHDRIELHRKRFPNQPAMYTELWVSWFLLWGESKPTRSAEDVAFASAQFIAMGGTYVCYYMFHGGTNFGRIAGGPWITTSYDYDAPLNEYGFPHKSKYHHLRRLHEAIKPYQSILLENHPVKIRSGVSRVEVHSYGASDKLFFITNTNPSTSLTLNFMETQLTIPAWSVSIFFKPEASQLKFLYNTATISDSLPPPDSSLPQFSTIRSTPSNVSYYLEPLSFSDTRPQMYSRNPLEQIRTTNDSTDYFWYISSPLTSIKTISISSPSDICYVYINDEFIGEYRHELSPWLSFLPFSFKLRVNKMNGVVKILCVGMGIDHWGVNLHDVRKGITSVKVNGRVVQGWNHVVGLLGEYNKVYESSSPKTISWHVHSSDTKKTRLTWYKLTFPIPQTSSSTYTLDLSTMGKGFVWVNGRAVGRYWSIRPPQKNCQKEGEYKGGKYNSGKRVCSEFTQRYYHVPKEWVEGGKTVNVILFEESSGDPMGVELIGLVG